LNVEPPLILLVLRGHVGVSPLASEDADVLLSSSDGAFELVDSGPSGGEEFFGGGGALADRVYQPLRDSAGGFADVCVVSDAKDGGGCSW